MKIFGPEAGAPVKEKGDRAEAGRPEGVAMEQATTVNRLPQSIGNTVTIFDEKERKRAASEAARILEWFEERVERARKEVFAEEVNVTPALAQLLLNRNENNRRISKTRLTAIKADIENGEWVLNGETLIVSVDGYLNDGQHRVLACIETGIPIRTLVVFGIKRTARTTTDQGTARTAANYLDMDGKHDTVVLAAVAKLLWQFHSTGRITHAGDLGRAPTKVEIKKTVEKHEKEIQRSIEHANKKTAKLLGPKSLVAFCHFIFNQINEVDASTFIERAIDGANLRKTDPILTLRERLLSDPKMPLSDRFEAIVRAWNAYRNRLPMAKIKITGKHPPAVEGWKGIEV
jgi:hypothetical protein